MSSKTSIEWTDATWNPIRGCSRVSEGCRNCYAEKVAYRFSGPGQPYEGLVGISNAKRKPVWNGTVMFVENHLLDPLKWKEPRRIFVNSMSDLFHENVPDEWIDRIFAVMALCPQHTFQVLTKRPERMLEYCSDDNLVRRLMNATDCVAKQIGGRARLILANCEDGFSGTFLPNVWLGVSAESQKAADERIPLLLQTPAAVRFISAEPLLGTLDISLWLTRLSLDWVIAGGESGPGARPMHPDWARSLRDQCQAAGVPFFMKQMGSAFGPNKGKDIPEELNIREFPEVSYVSR